MGRLWTSHSQLPQALACLRDLEPNESRFDARLLRRHSEFMARRFDPDPEGLGMLAHLTCARCKRDGYGECVSSESDAPR